MPPNLEVSSFTDDIRFAAVLFTHTIDHHDYKPFEHETRNVIPYCFGSPIYSPCSLVMDAFFPSQTLSTSLLLSFQLSSYLSSLTSIRHRPDFLLLSLVRTQVLTVRYHWDCSA